MPDADRKTVSASQVAGRIKLGARGCWLWQGAQNGHGYGALNVAGKQRGAHRVVYELLRGPIPTGLTLDHLCRRRHCVNPDHLEPVTIKENLRRGNGSTGRCFRKTRCKRGHAFTDENTYRPKRGGRICRACRRKPNGRGPYARPN